MMKSPTGTWKTHVLGFGVLRDIESPLIQLLAKTLPDCTGFQPSSLWHRCSLCMNLITSTIRNN